MTSPITDFDCVLRFATSQCASIGRGKLLSSKRVSDGDDVEASRSLLDFKKPQKFAISSAAAVNTKNHNTGISWHLGVNTGDCLLPHSLLNRTSLVIALFADDRYGLDAVS